MKEKIAKLAIYIFDILLIKTMPYSWVMNKQKRCLKKKAWKYIHIYKKIDRQRFNTINQWGV